MHDQTGSFTHFMRAYELDTTFTTALLSANASILNGWAGNDSITVLLAARRSSLSSFNRFWLSMFETAHKGDQAALFRITSELARQAPESYFPFVHSVVAIAVNQPRAALDVLLKADPDRGWMKNWFEYWYVRCEARHMLGDFKGELADSRIASITDIPRLRRRRVHGQLIGLLRSRRTECLSSRTCSDRRGST